jgi:hypothetical protein
LLRTGLEKNKSSWGYSSVGRALEWHSRGQGFDSPYLHSKSPRLRAFFIFGLGAGSPLETMQRSARINVVIAAPKRRTRPWAWHRKWRDAVRVDESVSRPDFARTWKRRALGCEAVVPGRPYSHCPPQLLRA